jgi:hypothetical protein
MEEPRSVWVEAPTAKAVVRIGQLNRGEIEAMSVRDAADAAKALGDPENEQNCPLCNEYFSTPAFVAHAADCIRARAPRRQFWVPPGIRGALAVFPEKTSYWRDRWRKSPTKA